MKPYIITSPDLVEENIVSGGVRVMWGLFGWLLAKGQIAYMNRWGSDDNVSIYPEIQTGNPTGSKNVVRYILNTPGIMGAIYQDGRKVPGPTVFDPNDKIYVFSRIYDQWNVPDDHILFLPIANLDVFKSYGKKRKKTCYLIGKGKNLQKHPAGSIELTRSFAVDQKALAQVLNECHTLYCYDRLTAMTELARLCGCGVKYYGEYTESDWKKYEPGTNGISFNGKEPQLEVAKFRAHYVQMIDIFEERLERFIHETQY